jgi:Dyp-type peroxidase family
MSSKMQEGIYHRSKPGNSFCVISLRAGTTKIDEIGNAIHGIWNRLIKLKKGITVDLDVDLKHRKIGNLTVLVAYGSNIFELPGSKRVRPMGFANTLGFKDQALSGNGPIFEGSSIFYQKDLSENHLLRDHILFQFIADKEFYTTRACVEVWKELHKLEKNGGPPLLRITGLYTGFQREDSRNWLGFHDGISNLKSRERAQIIFIDPRSVLVGDKWTALGTYLVFMRIALDLNTWEDTPQPVQQLVIGRDKLTGCPLIGIDKNKKPVKDSRCPVPGTSEIIDLGNEYFRDHRPYGTTTADRILQQSHIGSTRPIDLIPSWDKKSRRIYRQGFEFLVSSRSPPGFVAGLNFVSFQNTPERFFRSLNDQQTIPNKTAFTSSVENLEQFMSVMAAGVFFAPAITQGEPFPGAQVFFNTSEIKDLLQHQVFSNR